MDWEGITGREGSELDGWFPEPDDESLYDCYEEYDDSDDEDFYKMYSLVSMHLNEWRITNYVDLKKELDEFSVLREIIEYDFMRVINHGLSNPTLRKDWTVKDVISICEHELHLRKTYVVHVLEKMGISSEDMKYDAWSNIILEEFHRLCSISISSIGTIEEANELVRILDDYCFFENIWKEYFVKKLHYYLNAPEENEGKTIEDIKKECEERSARIDNLFDLISFQYMNDSSNFCDDQETAVYSLHKVLDASLSEYVDKEQVIAIVRILDDYHIFDVLSIECNVFIDSRKKERIKKLFIERMEYYLNNPAEKKDKTIDDVLSFCEELADDN